MAAINLSKTELRTCKAAVSSIVKVGELREAEFKPQSIDKRMLEENRIILEKLTYATGLVNKPDYIGDIVSIGLNRVQVKVLVATVQTMLGLQQRVRTGYEERADTDEAFQDVDGRRKADYLGAISARMNELTSIVEKARRAL